MYNFRQLSSDSILPSLTEGVSTSVSTSNSSDVEEEGCENCC